VVEYYSILVAKEYHFMEVEASSTLVVEVVIMIIQ
jgi:hypothetical protein